MRRKNSRPNERDPTCARTARLEAGLGELHRENLNPQQGTAFDCTKVRGYQRQVIASVNDILTGQREPEHNVGRPVDAILAA